MSYELHNVRHSILEDQCDSMGPNGDRTYLLVDAQLGYQHLCTEFYTTPDHSLIS